MFCTHFLFDCCRTKRPVIMPFMCMEYGHQGSDMTWSTHEASEMLRQSVFLESVSSDSKDFSLNFPRSPRIRIPNACSSLSMHKILWAPWSPFRFIFHDVGTDISNSRQPVKGWHCTQSQTWLELLFFSLKSISKYYFWSVHQLGIVKDTFREIWPRNWHLRSWIIMKQN